ncbi:hypothetical protein BDDG_12067 [Blastomyces dermatitidis ATCC 18188]|uniref:Uncharacterized protein n=1 Tax=Ajellomyces dermatitidis (strain ATCC 18188 / CBS 674.68) TaxID=653446 RepID=A0A0J9EMP5_AJEDA|nr:hypothetical protein BDDG_12067 [Blastomyces dermatitidis ATCC 18188]
MRKRRQTPKVRPGCGGERRYGTVRVQVQGQAPYWSCTGGRVDCGRVPVLRKRAVCDRTTPRNIRQQDQVLGQPASVTSGYVQPGEIPRVPTMSTDHDAQVLLRLSVRPSTVLYGAGRVVARNNKHPRRYPSGFPRLQAASGKLLPNTKDFCAPRLLRVQTSRDYSVQAIIIQAHGATRQEQAPRLRHV